MVDRIQTEHEMILSVQAEKMVADLQKAEKEVADLAKQFDRAQATGRKFEAFATRAANQNRALTKSANQMSHSIRNASYQVSDIAVQLEMGTHWSRVFAQQGSQILGGFGMWPAVIGAAVAALVPLAKTMGWFAEETEKADQELQSILDRSDQLRFGVNTAAELDAMRDYLDAQIELNRLQRQWIETDSLSRRQRIAEQAKEQKAAMAAARAILDEYKKAREQLERQELAYEDILGSAEGLRQANEALNTLYQSQLDKQAAMLGILQQQGRQIVQNVRNNPDYYDPRGEGAGAGDPWFVDNSGRVDKNIFANSTGVAGGGGGAAVAKEIEKIDKALSRHEQYVKDVQYAWDSFGNGIEDALMSFLDGAKSFEDAMKDMARSVISELFRVLVLQRIIGSAAGGTGIMGGLAGMFGDGAAFDGGKVTPFAKGGVVSSPTLFPMSGGAGLMGESGPEAIIPLQRTSSGDLGVAASPVVIHNYTGAPVTTEDRDGERHVIIGQAVQAVRNDYAQSMASGQGIWARGQEAGYTSRRKY